MKIHMNNEMHVPLHLTFFSYIYTSNLLAAISTKNSCYPSNVIFIKINTPFIVRLCYSMCRISFYRYEITDSVEAWKYEMNIA